MWIPLLIRTTAVLLVAVMHGALTNQPSSHAVKHLEKAMSFYFDGFRRIIEAFDKRASSTGDKTEIHLARFLLEMLWAALVWVALASVITFWTSYAPSFLQNNKNVSIKRENPVSVQPEQTSEKRVSGISFAPSVSTWFFYRPTYSSTPGTNFRIQPLDFAEFSDGRIFLKISICNIGEVSNTLDYPRVWYAPPNGQSSINWEWDSYFRLKPNECVTTGQWSKESVDQSFKLGRPFGLLNVAARDVSGVSGSIDLNDADSKGLLSF